MKTFFRWLLIAMIIAIAVTVVLNRQWVFDFWRGKVYQPSGEMLAIKKSLNLTEKGEFLFNATSPTLDTKEEFNDHCRENDEEIAVLGCYSGGSIFIYNITDAELAGIRELTTAHELLHAVYARMPEESKQDLRTSLEQVYQSNQAVLQEDLETYDEAERFEELYVRAGTEIKELPKDLEEHYAEIFRDQDGIVDFYEQYIAVFRAIEAELDILANELAVLAKEIEQKTVVYESEVNQLNENIAEFNNCAALPNCFLSENEFLEQRTELLKEQSRLESLYSEINTMIVQYNQKVEEYNADVLQSKRLNEMINSSVQPKQVN